MLDKLIAFAVKIIRGWWFATWTVGCVLLLIKYFIVPNFFWLAIIWTVMTAAWAIIILPAMKNAIWTRNPYVREPPMNIFCDVESAARYDWIEWSHWKLYFGSVFFMLPRILGICFVLPFGWIIHIVDMYVTGNGNYETEQPPLWMATKAYWKPFQMRPMASWFGVYGVEYKSHKISDFLADYEKYEKNMEGVFAPISICNHQTAFDMITLLDIFPCLSFQAKVGIQKIPSVGVICTRLQSIYIHRGDSSQSEVVLGKIKERCDNILVHKKRFPSLMIFPEGTTNNGEFLMKFKSGAFVHGVPFKIYALKYETSGLNPCLNGYNEPEMFLMNLSNWWCNLAIHSFDTPFDPRYVADKYGISMDDEKFWEYLAKETRYLYEYALGFGQATNGMRQKMQMEESFGMNMGYEKPQDKVEEIKKDTNIFGR